MARQSRPTFQKRREKQARKFDAKTRKAAAAEERAMVAGDPDLDGIKLGPQAPPEEWAAFIEDEAEEEEQEDEVESVG